MPTQAVPAIARASRRNPRTLRTREARTSCCPSLFRSVDPDAPWMPGETVRPRMVSSLSQAMMFVMVDRPVAPATLEAATTAGAAAWPGIQLERDVFIAFLQGHLESGERWLDSTHVPDLYLACACLRGNEQAWRELDRVFL